jgi:hypothetical protein
LFGQLTGGNLPDPATGRTKFLGILFHGKLSSAPSIRSQIGQEGIIEGNFTEEEVESLVQTLKSGQGRTATGESAPGRLTIMQAGGSVEANIDRWMAQFQQPDGKPSRDAAKIEEKEYDGLPVHLVDVAGTFVDRRGGPFNPNAQTVELENYRMLAAIIETKGGGNYFVKFTGPAETVEQNSAAFQRAIEMLQWE